MVIGISNVGKSTVINTLRSDHLSLRKATPVGRHPGVTRSVLEKIRINDEPKVYVRDTPGIMDSKADDLETAMKLALCHTVPDHIVGPIRLADFLLYWLNTRGRYGYVRQLGLDKPCDDIYEVLIRFAASKGIYRKARQADGAIVQRPDIDGAATKMVAMFRKGQFGLLMLDIPPVSV